MFRDFPWGDQVKSLAFVQNILCASRRRNSWNTCPVSFLELEIFWKKFLWLFYQVQASENSEMKKPTSDGIVGLRKNECKRILNGDGLTVEEFIRLL